MRSFRNVPMAVRGAAAALTAVGVMAGAWAASDAQPAYAAPPRLLASAGGPDSCGDNDHFETQGSDAGTTSKVCQGSGPVYIGPAVGQIARVVGPIVTGPSRVRSIVSAGDAIMGY